MSDEKPTEKPTDQPDAQPTTHPAPTPQPSQPAPAKPESLTGRASLHAGTTINGELQQTPAQRAAAGPRVESPKVRMDVLRDGSFGGEYYKTGETADVPEEHVETLTLSGFAARADRAELAQQARDAAAKDRADAKAAAETKRTARATAVQPLSTDTAPAKPKK